MHRKRGKLMTDLYWIELLGATVLVYVFRKDIVGWFKELSKMKWGVRK
jgi:hypothetical protein